MKAMKASWVHELVGRARQRARPRHVLWSGKTGQTSSSRPADSQVRVCTSLLDKRLERLSSQTCRLPAFEKVNGHHMVIFNPGTQQHVLAECRDLSAGWLRQGVWPQAVPQFAAAANRGFLNHLSRFRAIYG